MNADALDKRDAERAGTIPPVLALGARDAGRRGTSRCSQRPAKKMPARREAYHPRRPVLWGKFQHPPFASNDARGGSARGGAFITLDASSGALRRAAPLGNARMRRRATVPRAGRVSRSSSLGVSIEIETAFACGRAAKLSASDGARLSLSIMLGAALAPPVIENDDRGSVSCLGASLTP